MGAPSPVQPDQAIAWFRARTPMSKEAAEALGAQAKQRAFYVAGLAQQSLIEEVQGHLDKALAEGTTLEDFKADAGAKLTAAWGDSVKNPGHRLETIFRTNVQSAYGAGRYEEATDPDTLALRPVWRFDAVLDARTTDSCRACNGVTLPAEHPWWQSNLPPRHFNCRCSFSTLSRRQAERAGVTGSPPDVSAADGFGAPPT